LLGWIASDGSITNGSIKIEIKDVDIDILEILRDNICKSAPIIRRYNGSMDSISLSIHSIKIVEDVCRFLSIVPGPKSRTIKFPVDIPDDLKWHFIRGLFDGDGTIRKMGDNIHSRECSIASISQDMKEGIKDFCKIKCSVNHSSVVYTGVNSMKFLFTMYENASFKLERKHAEYIKYIEYYGFDGEKDNRMYGPNEKIILLRSIRKKDGEVQDFHSYVSAVRFLKQINPSACGSSIKNVVNKDGRSAFGYIWLLL
jgi:intein/homing endonuclease